MLLGNNGYSRRNGNKDFWMEHDHTEQCYNVAVKSNGAQLQRRKRWPKPSRTTFYFLFLSVVNLI